MNTSRVVAICFAALAIFVSLGPASSGLLIEGTPDRIVLEADEERLSDVLAALGSKFDVRLKPATAVADTRIHGRFVGALNDVIRQLLAGYDFVLTKRQNGGAISTDVVLLGRSNRSAMPPAPQSSQKPNPPRFDGFK